MKIFIKGGRVVDPHNDVDDVLDVCVDDGVIAEVGKELSGSADKEVDATGCFVVPGLVDIHVHLREPGQEHKETITTGTLAAVAGGFTSVACMPNTQPVNDCRSVTELVVRRAQEAGHCRVFPVGAISKGLEGRTLNEFAEMKEAGIVAVTDDGRYVMDSALMRRAFEYASTFDLPVLQHCEDHALSGNGAMHEGRVSVRNGVSAQPAAAESIAVARDLELVELTRARYHALHMSTEASLRLVRDAKGRGLPVTCEVAPHHFTLTDEACADYDTNAKVNPPLRGAEHVEAVKRALKDGTVDAIATDHAPHATVDKELEFGLAAFGISGIETAVPLCLALWRDDVLSLPRLIELLTCGPARVLGLDAGTLTVGARADIAVLDPDVRWTVTAGSFESMGKNTPFLGEELVGQARTTLVAGRVAYDRTAAG